eukprot:1709389-Rhodomonas_salina.1
MFWGACAEAFYALIVDYGEGKQRQVPIASASATRCPRLACRMVLCDVRTVLCDVRTVLCDVRMVLSVHACALRCLAQTSREALLCDARD